MATSYLINGRGDLDGLFKPRTSAAAAATGFRSNGGVDLAQRFEPRGATAAIAATGFRAGGSDLAQIFMDINAAPFTPIITRTMTAGTLGSPSFNIGYRNTASGYVAYGGQTMSAAPEWTKVAQLYRLDEINIMGTGGPDQILLRVSNVSAQPANSDNVWQSMALTGVFANSSGVSVRRVIHRSSNYVYNDYTTPNARPGALWQFGSNLWNMIIGNVYTLEIG